MIAVAVPATASAATACSYNSGAEVLEVTMSADGDTALLALGPGSEIQVRGSGPVLSCAGGTPTLANTEFVNVFDNSGNGNTRVSIIKPADFGAIGIILAMSGGSLDELTLIGSSAANHFVIGSGGIDSDGDGNKDVTFFGSVPETINVSTGPSADTVSARGSLSTGAALSGTFLSLNGGPGSDTLEGSEAGDRLEGDEGDDTLRGFGGNDGLIGDALAGNGNDTLDGGTGTDELAFPLAQNGVTVDLNKTTPQATGQGSDTISQIENVEGTSFDDTLTGDAGPNDLFGGAGNDTIDGRGGNDLLEASIGTDTVTYAAAPAAVAVDLGAGTATGGDGTDTVKNFENLVGSPFADTLTGSAAPNTITALGGSDVVQALGGADFVNVRDGAADNASCGTEIDKAISDRRSLDTIQPDCEQVDALPEPNHFGGGSADTSLDFRLAGARKQRLLKQKAVVVKVRCPQEACTTVASASGTLPKLKRPAASALSRLKLKTVTKRLPAGPAKTLKLHLNGKQRKAIRARLLEGEKPKLKVIVKATDAAGNVVLRTLGVTAKS